MNASSKDLRSRLAIQLFGHCFTSLSLQDTDVHWASNMCLNVTNLEIIAYDDHLKQICANGLFRKVTNLAVGFYLDDLEVLNKLVTKDWKLQRLVLFQAPTESLLALVYPTLIELHFDLDAYSVITTSSCQYLNSIKKISVTSDGTSVCLEHCIPYCNSLVYLELHMKVETSTMMLIATHCKSLQTFSNRYLISATGVLVVLQECKQLRVLRCAVYDETLQQMIPYAQKLRELTLYIGCMILPQIVRGMPNLCCLRVYFSEDKSTLEAINPYLYIGSP